MTLDKILTWFIRAWVTVVAVLNLISIVGILISATTIWAGIGRLQETYNPFNLANFVAEVIALAPAIAAVSYRDKRRRRIGVQPSEKVVAQQGEKPAAQKAPL